MRQLVGEQVSSALRGGPVLALGKSNMAAVGVGVGGNGPGGGMRPLVVMYADMGKIGTELGFHVGAGTPIEGATAT